MLQDPVGTIIHPSVYMILDEYCHVQLDSKNLKYRQKIDNWKPSFLPSREDAPWNTYDSIGIQEAGAVRILVCGNTGIGKSTLINGVFGAEVVGRDLHFTTVGTDLSTTDNKLSSCGGKTRC